jgi:hypothetical protein
MLGLMQEAALSVNSRYKDSVFSLLFGNPGTLRELYGALEGVSLPPDLPITINTLEGVLFMERVNDISFEVGDKLVVLIEHQSTINPNMALRILMYIARIYEKITGGRNIYSGKKLTIPRPHFIVLYNGPRPFPDEAILRLSDSFEASPLPGQSETLPPELELTLKVYNINAGHNEAMIRRSAVLKGYSVFVAKVREYEESLKDREAGVKAAVKYCVEQNILADFLQENASEVMNMLLTEWNWDDALAVRYEEGVEEGREEIAKNALREGAAVEFVQKITGLDSETIARLASSL